jgi:hypothetical protein
LLFIYGLLIIKLDLSPQLLGKKRGREPLPLNQLADETKRKRFYTQFKAIIDTIEQLNTFAASNDWPFSISALFTITNTKTGEQKIVSSGSVNKPVQYLQLLVKRLACLKIRYLLI